VKLISKTKCKNMVADITLELWPSTDTVNLREIHQIILLFIVGGPSEMSEIFRDPIEVMSMYQY
jgi:hypothetical protein